MPVAIFVIWQLLSLTKIALVLSLLFQAFDASPFSAGLTLMQIVEKKEAHHFFTDMAILIFRYDWRPTRAVNTLGLF